MSRSTAFDPEEILHKAMMLFWRQGFEATSLQDLTTTLGINRFSIYNTFGDKQTLFLKTLQYYEEQVFVPQMAELSPAEQGLPRLQAYFKILGERLMAEPGALGCFLQNTALEGGVDDRAVNDYIAGLLERLRSGFYSVVKAAQAQGQINRSLDLEDCADFLLTQVQGVITVRRVSGAGAMQRSLNFLRGEIARW